jgi:hypothetical protein
LIFVESSSADGGRDSDRDSAERPGGEVDRSWPAASPESLRF